ncbi:MAG: OmpA family protein [Alphaproteobacteria bacterium]|nr:OmpA family protein [Alphaproteobacteria bacterium]
MSKKLVLSSVYVLLGLGAITLQPYSAQAQAVGSLSYYNLTPEEQSRDYMAWKNFLEYEDREPCQHYWPPPAGYVMTGCRVHKLATEAAEASPAPEAPAPAAEEKLLPIISSYTIYFDFDRSNINPDQKPTLDRIASEIAKYHPTQVTVAGYTDTSGTKEYNMTLSQERAKSVASALTDEGVQNRVIDKRAHGEEDLAVPTADGTRNQENRRVIVDFRR